MIKIYNIQSRQLLMMTLFLEGLRQRAASLIWASSKMGGICLTGHQDANWFKEASHGHEHT